MNEDTLIGRVASNDSDAIEWTRFESLAAGDAGVWERLAATDDVDPPRHAFDPSPIARVAGGGVVSRFAGWAVAAVVALAWAGLRSHPATERSLSGTWDRSRGPTPPPHAG